MSTFVEKFNILLWFIRVLDNSWGVTFEDIDSKWRRAVVNKDGGRLPESTFHNYCREITELTGYKIKCVKKSTTYYYSIDRNSVPCPSNLQDALLNSFLVQGRLLDNPALSGHVTIREIPKIQIVQTLLDAIESRRPIKVIRRKPRFPEWLLPIFSRIDEFHPGIIERTFYASQKERFVELDVEPLSINLGGRGYLISRLKGKRSTCVISLGNISSIKILEGEYEMPENVKLGFGGIFPIFPLKANIPDDRLIYHLEKSLHRL